MIKIGKDKLGDPAQVKARAMEIFVEIDMDGNKMIDEAELKAAMANMGIRLMDKEVRRMMDEADEDGYAPLRISSRTGRAYAPEGTHPPPATRHPPPTTRRRSCLMPAATGSSTSRSSATCVPSRLGTIKTSRDRRRACCSRSLRSLLSCRRDLSHPCW
jgi:hypothetical protein